MARYKALIWSWLNESVANTPSISRAITFCRLETACLPPLLNLRVYPRQGEEWILLCRGVREQIIQTMFSSQTKQTVHIIAERSRSTGSGATGILSPALLSSYPPLHLLLSRPVLRGVLLLPLLGSLSTPLTCWPRDLSLTFLKAKSLVWKQRGDQQVYKHFIFVLFVFDTWKLLYLNTSAGDIL